VDHVIAQVPVRQWVLSLPIPLRPLQAAAVTYRIAFGSRAGQRVLTLRGAMTCEVTARQPLCADIHGFSLHAAVRIEAHERRRLEPQPPPRSKAGEAGHEFAA